jgi:hypothetical protein
MHIDRWMNHTPTIVLKKNALKCNVKKKPLASVFYASPRQRGIDKSFALGSDTEDFVPKKQHRFRICLAVSFKSTTAGVAMFSSRPQLPSRPPAAAMAAFLLVITLLVFWPGGTGFLSDDYVLLRAIERDGPWAAGFYRGLGVNFLRPLSTACLALEHSLFGLHAIGFHLVSLALHLLNAALVGLLAVRLLPPCPEPSTEAFVIPIRPCDTAMLAAFFFLVLPCHSEAVMWISGHADLLATLGCLIALNAWFAWRARGGAARLLLAFGACLLALTAKESALTLGAAIVALEWLAPAATGVPHAPAARSRWALGAWLALPCAYYIVRAALLGTWVGGYGTARHLNVSPVGLLINTAKAAVRMILPPFALAPVAAGSVLVVLAVLLLGALLLALHRGSSALATDFYGRLDPRFALALSVAWLIVLAPALPLPVSLRLTEGEGLLYLPSVFATLLLVHPLLALLIEPPRRSLILPRMLSSLLLIAFFQGTMLSAHSWREAGDFAQRFLAAASPLPAGARLINLPDHLNGAYIFRNGFPEARRLRGEPPLQLDLLQTFRTLDDRLTFHPTATTLTLSAPPGSHFTLLPSASPGSSVQNATATLPLNPNQATFVYTAGQFSNVTAKP